MTAAARRALLAVVGVVATVAIWAGVAVAINNPARVPTPGAVWTLLRQNMTTTPGLAYAGVPGSIWSNTWFTVQHTLEGFILGAVVGYAAGLALGSRRASVQVANTLLVLYASVPAVILTPFVVLWFGADGSAPLVVVAFYVFVLVAIAAQNSAGQLAGRYTSFARSLGARTRHVAIGILLPGCLPAAMAVSRIALAVAWGLEVATELFGSAQGSGRVVLYYQQTGNPAGIAGVIILLALIALAVEVTLRTVTRALTRWQDRTTGGSL